MEDNQAQADLLCLEPSNAFDRCLWNGLMSKSLSDRTQLMPRNRTEEKGLGRRARLNA